MRNSRWRIHGGFFAAAVVLAGAAGWQMLRDSEQAPAWRSRRVPAAAPAREDSIEPAIAVPPSAGIRPQATPIQSVSAPREVAADPAKLRQWLFEVPDDQFARLAGTSRLSGYVAAVYGSLWKEDPELEDEGPTEAGEFLVRLNGRIRAVRK